MHLFPLAASGFAVRSRSPPGAVTPNCSLERTFAVSHGVRPSQISPQPGSGAEPAPPDQAAQVLGRSAERGKVLRSSLDWLVDR
jgi:hypothetical protein